MPPQGIPHDWRNRRSEAGGKQRGDFLPKRRRHNRLCHFILTNRQRLRKDSLNGAIGRQGSQLLTSDIGKHHAISPRHVELTLIQPHFLLQTRVLR